MRCSLNRTIQKKPGSAQQKNLAFTIRGFFVRDTYQTVSSHYFALGSIHVSDDQLGLGIRAICLKVHHYFCIIFVLPPKGGVTQYGYINLWFLTCAQKPLPVWWWGGGEGRDPELCQKYFRLTQQLEPKRVWKLRVA